MRTPYDSPPPHQELAELAAVPDEQSALLASDVVGSSTIFKVGHLVSTCVRQYASVCVII